MANDPIEPSRPGEPELMRISKARPPSGDLDFTKFGPRKTNTGKTAQSSGGGYDGSRYMAANREEDPWPDEDAFQNSHDIRVTLTALQVTTAVADLAFDKPAHVKCDLQILNAPNDTSVKLRLQWANAAAGPWTDLKEVVSKTITAAPANQSVEADLLLSTPNPVPAFGADVFYRAVATNNQAVQRESAPVSLKYRKLTDFVGAPELAHADHSMVPRVGAAGEGLKALAAFLKKLAAQPPASADKAVAFGFSAAEADPARDRKLSKARAEVVRSLLDRDLALWESNKKNFTLKDTQQVLADLAAAYSWPCDPGPVDGIDGPKTRGGVKAFQRECNTRYNQGLTVDGVCGKKTWNGVHRALCALMAKELDPAFADPTAPAWQLPDWHAAVENGCYPNGRDFPPAIRSAEVNLFHPSDAPTLAAPGAQPLTKADNPVEDDTKYSKRKIASGPGAAPADPDRAVPVIETYDPSESVTETGNNAKRIERSGQVVDVQQWVNLTTKDDGRDGKGSKIKLRIRSRDSLRDEAGAKKLPDQVFLKVVYSADAGAASRLPRSDADNKFGLVQTANLGAYVAPGAPSLQRAPAGGWQSAPPANGWEYTATIGTGGAKMVELELDLGMCGGDTCEVQVGATNACDSARVRFVNWRKLQYELMVPNCLAPVMTAVAGGGFDLGGGLKTMVDNRLGAGFVRYDLDSSHSFAQAAAGAGTWVPAAFVKAVGRDQYIYASGWAAPTGVAFAAAPNSRTMQITLCDRAFSTNVGAPVNAVKDATAARTDIDVANLGATVEGSRIYAFPLSPANNAPSVNVTGLTWTAKVTAAANQVTPTLTTTLAADDTLGDNSWRMDVLGPDNTVATSRVVAFPAGSTALNPAAQTAILDLVNFSLEKNFRYRCATAIRITIFSKTGAPQGAGRNAALRTGLQTEFDAKKAPVAYHPGLDPDGNPRTGPMNAAWFSHPDMNTLRIDLPKRATVNDPFLPGDFAGALSGTLCPVTWRAAVVRTYAINGNSGGGKQILVLGRPDGPTSSTVCHELGHSMGLSAFINGVQDQCGNAPGMPTPKHVDNGGRTYFDAAAPYTQGRRNLHRGPHCATGIPVGDLPDPQFNNKDGSCIMYGAGGNADTRPSYCPDCSTVLRARTLKDIRSGWNARF